MEFKNVKNTNKWPLFLKNFSFLIVRSEYSSTNSNQKLFKSQLASRLTPRGFVNLDKPCGWNSHEISLWIKKCLGIEKAKSIEKTDTNLTGCVLICLGNICFLENTNFEWKKDYVCVFKLNSSIIFGKINLQKIITALNGYIFDTSSFFSNIRTKLKVRNKFSSYLLEIDNKKRVGILEISGNLSLSSPFFFFNFGFVLGENINLLEIRKIRFGGITEDENLFNLHDIVDANWINNCLRNDFFLQKIFSPFEFLLSFHKRIIVKNSAINSICYGAKLLISGILRFEKNIESEENIILMSTRGEFVALGKSKLNKSLFFRSHKGIAVTIDFIVMEKDYYPKRWGFGVIATKKNLLISAGIRAFYKKKKFISIKWWTKKNKT